MTAPEFVNTEIPRDRYGRPMITQPGSTKRVPYRRTTTFVGALEDTYNLQKWKMRRVAYGMGQRKDLVLAAAASDPEEKHKLNEIVENALEAAESSAAATTGTALHALTERIDRGQPLGVIPNEYENDIAAYQAATQKIEWLGIESFRVYDRWQVAGTADRIGKDQHGRIRIYDIKGLTLDTKLPTPSGWTTMGAVKVGDQVLDEQGNPCNVILKSDAKNIGTYLVTFDDGAQIICDSEHIWWTTTRADRDRGEGPKPRQVQEVLRSIKSGGQNQHCVPVAEPLTLPDIALTVDPYLLGAWLGDGHINRNVITKADDLFDIIESDGYRLGMRQVDSRSGAVSRSVAGLCEQLKTAGLLGHKRIPDEYLRASYPQRLRLLQGLMDTDGTWNTARKRAMFTSTDKGLALGVEELLLTLGQRPHSYSIVRTGFGKTVTAYDVEFTPRDLMPFRLPRKMAKVVAKKVETHASRRVITSIVPGPDVETACIGVDSPNNVYLCSERFIPTHNTGSIAYPHKMAMQLAMYARSLPYDIPTDTRGEPEPALDLNRGVIIHLPAGEGRCDLYEIDIASGWGACLIAHQVWKWRATKDLTKLVDPDAAPQPSEIEQAFTELGCARRAANAQTLEELRQVWNHAKKHGALTEDFRAFCTERSRELAAATNK